MLLKSYVLYHGSDLLPLKCDGIIAGIYHSVSMQNN
jgi:hypothetical protein